MDQVDKSKVSLVKIKEFFNYPTTKEFREDWMKLSAEDQAQIRSGFESGSFTY